MKREQEPLGTLYQIKGIEVADGWIFFGFQGHADVILFSIELEGAVNDAFPNSEKDLSDFTQREILAALTVKKRAVHYDVVCSVSIINTVTWNPSFRARLTPADFQRVLGDCEAQYKK